MNSFELARLNLIRRKTSTLIAMISIALSVAVGGMVFRVFSISNERFTTIAGGGASLVGAKAGGLEILLGALNAEGDVPGYIPEALYDTLSTDPQFKFQDGSTASTEGIKLMVPLLYAAKYKDHKVLSTNEKFLDRPFGDDSVIVSEGRWFESPKEIVVGSQVARKQGLSLGQEIALRTWSSQGVSGDETTFTVVGILRESRKVWDRILFNSLEDGQGMVELSPVAMQSSIWGSKVLSYFWIFQDGKSAAVVEEIISKRSIAQFVSVYKEKLKLRELTGTGEDLGLAILAFIVLLGALSVTAIMITRFDSMHLQVAVLRAIGYQKASISKWLFFEGLLLGTVSVGLGIILEWILFPVVAGLLGSSLPPAAGGFSWFLPYPVWAVALVSTVFATVIPLYRLYRQDVHSSLKTV